MHWHNGPSFPEYLHPFAATFSGPLRFVAPASKLGNHDISKPRNVCRGYLVYQSNEATLKPSTEWSNDELHLTTLAARKLCGSSFIKLSPRFMNNVLCNRSKRNDGLEGTKNTSTPPLAVVPTRSACKTTRAAGNLCLRLPPSTVIWLALKSATFFFFITYFFFLAEGEIK